AATDPAGAAGPAFGVAGASRVFSAIGVGGGRDGVGVLLAALGWGLGATTDDLVSPGFGVGRALSIRSDVLVGAGLRDGAVGDCDWALGFRAGRDGVVSGATECADGSDGAVGARSAAVDAASRAGGVGRSSQIQTPALTAIKTATIHGHRARRRAGVGA